jgi:hypothetical protein
MIRNALSEVSGAIIQLFQIEFHGAHTEDTNAAVSEQVEKMFPVYRVD